MPGEQYLADTNILLRLVLRDDPEYSLVRTAVQKLQRDSVSLCYTSQNLVEFWNVATRPRNRNGFGLSIAEVDREVGLIEADLALLPENDRIHPLWRRLVVAHAVSGVQVHDARLVAAMQANGVKYLLTLNDQDFSRYTAITVLHPREVAKV
jgi:predicted nucleic acid-binding protein